MANFNLSILTPDGSIYDNEVESLVAPGVNGYFGVLAAHASMIAATRPGEFKIKEDREIFFATGSGILEVSGAGVIFLADYAELADNINDARDKVVKLQDG